MSEILREESGYDVTLFNGDEGFPISDLRNARPDLLIVDLLLGGASGWEIVALARADVSLAAIPIIVCSADVAQLKERANELAAIGNMHILAKPFGIDDLTRLVADVLGQGAMPAAARRLDIADAVSG